MLRFVVLAIWLRGCAGQVSTTPTPEPILNCTGEYTGIKTRDELYTTLLPRIVSFNDSNDTVLIKSVFLDYLTRTPVFIDLINCQTTRLHRLLQEDEDGDDEGNGVGGAAGAIGALTGTNANPLDNTNVLNGVRRILANVFTGNLIGILQESVALRSPEPVSTVFTDVLSTLFGSQATAGVTGIIGNLTSTPSTLNVTSTVLPPGYEAYIQQHYAQQQYLAQQQLLQQQQGIGGQSQGQFGTQQQQIGGQGQFVPTQQQYLQQQYFQQQGVRRPVGGVNGGVQNGGINGGGLNGGAVGGGINQNGAFNGGNVNTPVGGFNGVQQNGAFNRPNLQTNQLQQNQLNQLQPQYIPQQLPQTQPIQQPQQVRPQSTGNRRKPAQQAQVGNDEDYDDTEDD